MTEVTLNRGRMMQEETFELERVKLVDRPSALEGAFMHGAQHDTRWQALVDLYIYWRES